LPHLPSFVPQPTKQNSGCAKSGEKGGENETVEKTGEQLSHLAAAHEAGNRDCRPNLCSYAILINAYVRARDADQAQSTLFRVYKEYQNGDKDGNDNSSNRDLKPNTKLISLVIGCWQKSGRHDAGERAEALLDWMISLYEKSGDEEVRPNEYSFCSAITAWGKSRQLAKAARARRILDRMIDLHESGRLSARPNTHCYTAVINSCAFCENDASEKRQALNIAIQTYNDLVTSDYGRPNEVTFANMLTALRNLLPAGVQRTAAIGKIFQSAARDGLVDDFVLRRVQSALTAGELLNMLHFVRSTEADADTADGASLTPDGQVLLDHLPMKWRRNARTRGPR
jgi:hypothetical protein